MSAQKRHSDLLTLTAIFGLASLGCVLIYGLRVLISGRLWYLYLVWNLALAFVPFLIAAIGSTILAHMTPGRFLAVSAAPFALIWLLFYPNAPYILTDFIHVIDRTYLRVSPSEWLGINALIWYDLLMNAVFAFIGHFMGLVSMWLVHSALRRAWGAAAARALVAAAILLAGFGIYLGRFSRLSSWDALLDPHRVINEVRDAATDPKAILFSFTFAVFIALTYGALAVFKRVGVPPQRISKN
ncbi:MAG: DUF1361 domain-containing protein [Rectinemataceae bacterium]